MPLLSPEINVLEKICTKVSKIIIRDFGEIEKLQVSKKGPGDFVTKTDQKVEKVITLFTHNQQSVHKEGAKAHVNKF